MKKSRSNLTYIHESDYQLRSSDEIAKILIQNFNHYNSFGTLRGYFLLIAITELLGNDRYLNTKRHFMSQSSEPNFPRA